MGRLIRKRMENPPLRFHAVSDGVAVSTLQFHGAIGGRESLNEPPRIDRSAMAVWTHVELEANRDGVGWNDSGPCGPLAIRRIRPIGAQSSDALVVLAVEHPIDCVEPFEHGRGYLDHSNIICFNFPP